MHGAWRGSDGTSTAMVQCMYSDSAPSPCRSHSTRLPPCTWYPQWSAHRSGRTALCRAVESPAPNAGRGRRVWVCGRVGISITFAFGERGKERNPPSFTKKRKCMNARERERETDACAPSEIGTWTGDGRSPALLISMHYIHLRTCTLTPSSPSTPIMV